MELLDECDHLFEVVEILPVHDEIHSEGELSLVDAAADGAGEFDLVGVSLCAGDPVRRFFARVLKADLNVIQACGDERLKPLFIQSDAGGDEVGVEAGGLRGGDQFG